MSAIAGILFLGLVVAVSLFVAAYYGKLNKAGICPACNCPPPTVCPACDNQVCPACNSCPVCSVPYSQYIGRWGSSLNSFYTITAPDNIVTFTDSNGTGTPISGTVNSDGSLSFIYNGTNYTFTYNNGTLSVSPALNSASSLSSVPLTNPPPTVCPSVTCPTCQVCPPPNVCPSCPPPTVCPPPICPPSPSGKSWVYQGCFYDAPNRSLPHQPAGPAQPISQSACQAAAMLIGDDLVGLESSGQCWSGNSAISNYKNNCGPSGCGPVPGGCPVDGGFWTMQISKYM